MRSELVGKSDDEIAAILAVNITWGVEKMMADEGFTAHQIALALLYAVAKFQKDHGVNAAASFASKVQRGSKRRQ